VTLTNGFQLVSCPLVASPDNSIATLLPPTGLPVQTAVYKFNGSSYTSDTVIQPRGTPVPPQQWSQQGVLTLNVGEGAFIFLPGGVGASQTVTFVGTVQQASGSTPTTYPAGFSIISSQVPLAGGVQTTLGYSPVVGDIIYTFDPAAQSYVSYSFIQPRGTNPVPPPQWGASGEPSIAVAQSFFVSAQTGGSWANNFTVH